MNKKLHRFSRPINSLWPHELFGVKTDRRIRERDDLQYVITKDATVISQDPDEVCYILFHNESHYSFIFWFAGFTYAVFPDRLLHCGCNGGRNQMPTSWHGVCPAPLTSCHRRHSWSTPRCAGWCKVVFTSTVFGLVFLTFLQSLVNFWKCVNAPCCWLSTGGPWATFGLPKLPMQPAGYKISENVRRKKLCSSIFFSVYIETAQKTIEMEMILSEMIYQRQIYAHIDQRHGKTVP